MYEKELSLMRQNAAEDRAAQRAENYSDGMIGFIQISADNPMSQATAKVLKLHIKSAFLSGFKQGIKFSFEEKSL